MAAIDRNVCNVIVSSSPTATVDNFDKVGATAVGVGDTIAGGAVVAAVGREIERTAWLLDNLRAIENSREIPWPRLQRLLIHDDALDLISLHTARAAAGTAAMSDAEYCRELLRLPPEEQWADVGAPFMKARLGADFGYEV